MIQIEIHVRIINWIKLFGFKVHYLEIEDHGVLRRYYVKETRFYYLWV